MVLGKWFKNQVVGLSIAVSNVQKTALGQEKVQLSSGNSKQERKLEQTNLMQALLNGEVTQEVKNLRWRTYLIMQASKGVKSNVVGWTKDENGDEVPVIEMSTTNYHDAIDKVKVDTTDPYELKMVVKNDFESLGLQDMIGDDKNESIAAIDFATAIKAEKPIQIKRHTVPQFELEAYANRVNIRKVDYNTVMLEFCVSKYPNVDNRTSRLFVSEVKKVMEGKRSSMLDIDEVTFITYNTIGSPDFLEYSYVITGFNKVIEFDGSYIIKFLGSITTNGVNILEKYRDEALDFKYLNKEKKSITI